MLDEMTNLAGLLKDPDLLATKGYLAGDWVDGASGYTFDVTNHISNIVRNDSLNFDLGLVVTGNITDNTTVDALLNASENTSIKYPRAATLNPLGSVLIGSNPNANQSDKKVQLELTYSSY